jgi:hypothetical protein
LGLATVLAAIRNNYCDELTGDLKFLAGRIVGGVLL